MTGETPERNPKEQQSTNVINETASTLTGWICQCDAFNPPMGKICWKCRRSYKVKAAIVEVLA